MKKIFAVMFAVLFLAGSAWAQCQGTQCIGTGSFNTEAKAFNAVGDLHGDFGGNSVAFGGQGAIGGADSQASGFVVNGKAGAASNQGVGPGVFAVGGAHEIGGSFAVPGWADSGSSTSAHTGGKVNVFVQPNFFGFGAAQGTTAGFAAQGSLNGTAVVDHGITGGVAKQGSAGAFVGGAVVAAGPFNTNLRYAGVEASIDMDGNSYSLSQAISGPGYNGLRNDVTANTGVNSYGNEWRTPGATATYLDGGWVASGGIHSATIMTPGNFAVANAQYDGRGDLGCNYNGFATGYTQVDKYTATGMNGATYVSQGQAKVGSSTTFGQPVK